MTDLRVGQQFITRAGNPRFHRTPEHSRCRKFQPLLGILFHHDDGFSLIVLQVVKDFEHHVDKTRLEADRGFVHQQNVGFMTKARDIPATAAHRRKAPWRHVSPRSEPRIFVEDHLGGALGLLWLIFQKTTHPEVFLNSHARKNGLVLQNVGNTGLAELFVGRKPGHISPFIIRAHIDVAGKDIVETKIACRTVDLPAPLGRSDTRTVSCHTQIDVVQNFHFAIAGPQIFYRNVGWAFAERLEMINGDVLGNFRN